MLEQLKDRIAPFWPVLRLRTILFAVLLFAAVLPAVGAVALRVYENTLVRQIEAELVAQGAALASMAALDWPGAPPPQPRPMKPPPGYFQPEFATVDIRRDAVLPERPAPSATDLEPDPEAAAVAGRLAPVIDSTVRTTLASAILLDRSGVIVGGPERGGSLAALPEVRAALAGAPRTVLRINGDYLPESRFEWISQASGLRLHHARPVIVGGQVRGVLLLSRSPRAQFRALYEDRWRLAAAAGLILGVLGLLAGLLSRGVTRPIETLSAASRALAGGSGVAPRTPRTAAVEIRQLYADFRAMAERIERRGRYLKDFAAAVSHEFKTPLAGINGAVELLQDHFETMAPNERRRFLDNIAGDSARLSQLVTRLLDLARADMATPEAGVSSRVAEPILRASGTEARTDFAIWSVGSSEAPPVAAPEAVVESVLTILFQNARQAGATSASFTVSTEPGAVLITVTDDGPGVPEADRERLFEPFFTSRRSEGGTGLGLPIARSLLAANGGTLELVESAEGAVFQVRLPQA